MNISVRLLLTTVVVLSALPAFAQDKPDALKTYRYGRDLESQGRMDEASQTYDKAVAICLEEIGGNPSSLDSYAVLTWSLQRQKKYGDVITWGLKAMQVSPNEYRVTETMGEAYFYLSNYKESLRSMQRYVDSAPQGDRVSTAYFFMGEIYRNQKRYNLADIAYTTAVNLEGGVANWWLRLGTVRELAGDKANAAQAYDRAVKLNPALKEAAEGFARTR